MFTALVDLARRIGYLRITVDWLLRSDIGEVIKTIVADEAAFPDYAIRERPAGRKNRRRKKRGR
jgi:hypothetical protein